MAGKEPLEEIQRIARGRVWTGQDALEFGLVDALGGYPVALGLVREAIGFDARRGDSVRVMNSSFLTPEPVADLPEVPMWEQGWFLDIVKQVGGLLLVLILIFVVLRPTMKRLTASHTELATTSGGAAAAGDSEGARVEGPLGHAGEGDDVLLGSDGEPIQLPGDVYISSSAYQVQETKSFPSSQILRLPRPRQL